MYCRYLREGDIALTALATDLTGDLRSFALTSFRLLNVLKSWQIYIEHSTASADFLLALLPLQTIFIIFPAAQVSLHFRLS
jgi:hypothetical protein